MVIDRHHQGFDPSVVQDEQSGRLKHACVYTSPLGDSVDRMACLGVGKVKTATAFMPVCKSEARTEFILPLSINLGVVCNT